MDPYDLASYVRTAIATLETSHSRGDLAKRAKVSRSVMSDFLNKKVKQPQVGMDKVSNLARSLSLPIARLLGPALLNTPVALPVTGQDVNSPSQHKAGGVDAGAASTRVLELEQRVAELVRLIREHVAKAELVADESWATEPDRLTRRRVQRTIAGKSRSSTKAS